MFTRSIPFPTEDVGFGLGSSYGFYNQIRCLVYLYFKKIGGGGGNRQTPKVKQK